MIENKNTQKVIPNEARYNTATKYGWNNEMMDCDPIDESDKDFSGMMGEAITDFTIEAAGIKKARVRVSRGGWLPYKTGFNTKDGLGNGKPITGIEIVGSGYLVGIHAKGGSWLSPVKTSDVEGEVVIGGGMAIDAIWVSKI